MKPDIERLYRQMARMRFFEEAQADLWDRGLIPGEMHLGIGEEAVVAGVLDHLEEGDALALDHRSTPPLVARGVDLASMLLEVMGEEEGLCRGMGGHMHLFSREHLAGSSGIVGSSAPLGAGFALAAQCLSPGAVAFSFFGDGAANQGLVLESLNLASAWKLPQVFVCKDNRWAITTRTRSVTGGCLARRAASFGMPAYRVDGTQVEKVWVAAGKAVRRARAGRGPSFILASCPRMEGHFLGDPLLRVYREPLKQTVEIGPPLARAMLSKPLAALIQRCGYLGNIGRTIATLGGERYLLAIDPLRRGAKLLSEEARARIESEAKSEVAEAVSRAMERRGRND
ncbi:MAG: thiamine pyrophosphate-dependent dehydrogenase E1 component subunit alpha [Actinobacteria bacterium]|nr:thiamine pyrophosphate-dependent dehydrogenase E1 component subunit alpha [Actinomycetota bacterium]